jgi:inorganic pyrophosphatase
MDVEAEEMTFKEKLDMVVSIGDKIKKGAYAFLMQEYCLMLIFVFFFLIIVVLVVDVYGLKSRGISFRMYAGCAFVIGSLTSILCGYIGMDIAVRTNYKTTFCAT